MLFIKKTHMSHIHKGGPYRMGSIAVFFIMLSIGISSITAQNGAPGLYKITQNEVIKSQSEQFEVLVPPIVAKDIKNPIKGIENQMIRLDGDLLVVMAEKMASSFYMFMSLPRKWDSKVFFKINPLLEPDQEVFVQVRRFRDQTHFAAELPYFITKKKLGRLLVRIVLHEFLLQYPGRHQEPPPVWVVRALEREFLEGTLWRPMLEPGKNIHLNQQFVDPISISQKLLNEEPPMSFEELSFPPPEAHEESLREYFDVSSHIFLRKLCDLPGGKKLVVSWMQSLNSHLNWQVGFLKEFRPYFSSYLDVEKWWSIQGLKLIRRNQFQMLQPYESMVRLEQLLVKFIPEEESPKQNDSEGANSTEIEKDIQLPNSVKLQEFVRKTPFSEHSAELLETQKRLMFLHAQSHPLVADTLGFYIHCIDGYLSHKSYKPGGTRKRNPETFTLAAQKRFIKDLDKADLMARSSILLAAEIRYGVVPEQEFIPDNGSRVNLTEPNSTKIPASLD